MMTGFHAAKNSRWRLTAIKTEKSSSGRISRRDAHTLGSAGGEPLSRLLDANSLSNERQVDSTGNAPAHCGRCGRLRVRACMGLSRGKPHYRMAPTGKRRRHNGLAEIARPAERLSIADEDAMKNGCICSQQIQPVGISLTTQIASIPVAILPQKSSVCKPSRTLEGK